MASDDDDDLLADVFKPITTTTKRRATSAGAGGRKDGLSFADLIKEQEMEQKEIAKSRGNSVRGGGAAASSSTSAIGGGGGGKNRRVVNEDGTSDSEDDLSALRDRIKGLNKSVAKENENDMDMDKEDFMDWLGTSSVFTMAESSTLPSLVCPSNGWGRDYTKLSNASKKAGESLPDVLCMLGPVRWLKAVSLASPAGFVDWLMKVVTLHEDPAMVHGAYLNIKAMMRGEDVFAPYPEGLSDWSLTFEFLMTLLEPYGIKLTRANPSFVRKIDTLVDINYLLQKQAKEAEKQSASIQIDLSDSNDGPTTTITTSNRGGSAAAAATVGVPKLPKLEKTGIPPTLNLRYLFSILTWSLQDEYFVPTVEETVALLQLALVLTMDRYIQADCPQAVQQFITALLQHLPSHAWPSPSLPTLLTYLFDNPYQGMLQLGTTSLLHIARSLSMDTTRGKELVMSLVKKLLEERIIEATLGANGENVVPLKSINVLTDTEGYFQALLSLCENQDGDTLLDDLQHSERLMYIIYCLELLCQASRSRVSRAFVGELGKRLSGLERARIRRADDDYMQTAKDLLAQEILVTRVLKPAKGIQTTLTSFVASSSSSSNAVTN